MQPGRLVLASLSRRPHPRPALGLLLLEIYVCHCPTAAAFIHLPPFTTPAVYPSLSARFHPPTRPRAQTHTLTRPVSSFGRLVHSCRDCTFQSTRLNPLCTPTSQLFLLPRAAADVAREKYYPRWSTVSAKPKFSTLTALAMD